MPAVSVILPTCDRPDLVPRAVASVLGQDFSDFELLLIDANRTSPPLGANAALAPLLADPRLRVLDGRHTRNASAARNVGLRVARGPWITFLDDDDEYLPAKISAQLALATAAPAPLVLCGYEFVWPRRRRRRQTARTFFQGDEILTHAAFNTPLLFHRRDDGLLFDEQLPSGHDVLYALTMLDRQRCDTLPCVPRPLVTVHPQAQSAHGDREGAWRGCLAAARFARGRFSRAARRAFLAHGRLERATAGHGDSLHFARCVGAVLRTRGRREWRWIIYAALTRFRR